MSPDDPSAEPDVPMPAPAKEVVRLPDGRELTYYPFPDAPPPTAPARPGRPEGR